MVRDKSVEAQGFEKAFADHADRRVVELNLQGRMERGLIAVGWDVIPSEQFGRAGADIVRGEQARVPNGTIGAMGAVCQRPRARNAGSVRSRMRASAVRSIPFSV